MLFALLSFCALARTTLAHSIIRRAAAISAEGFVSDEAISKNGQETSATTATETGGSYYCDDDFNFVNGVYYSQISLTSYCPCCNCNPVYGAPNDVSKAVAWCKGKCDQQGTCTGFFFQRHGNGHEICGFYSGLDPLRSPHKTKHGHQAGSQICAKRKTGLEYIPNSALVTAFEYTFEEVGHACAAFGALGYTAVHISPPQDNICLASWSGDQLSTYNSTTRRIANKDLGWYNSWHCKYQPRSYKISGCWSHGQCATESAFYAMAKKCRLHNVHVLVDLVVNHMMVGFREFEPKPGAAYAWPAPGAGSPDPPRTFAAPQDFHSCVLPNATATFEWKTRNCDLHNLADLATESSAVREAQVKYINRLTALGASAFRIDAAGCMSEDDTAYLAQHISDVRSDFGGGRPYIFQEVPSGHRKLTVAAAQAADKTTDTMNLHRRRRSYRHRYYNLGMQVTEHEPEHWLWEMANGNGSLGDVFGMMLDPQNAGLVHHGKGLTFVDNHDSQRYHNVLTHKTAGTYMLAQMWLLTFPYGTVKVMSSYEFSGDFDPRPQVSPQGNCPWDKPAGVTSKWKCEYGWRGIKNAVSLRNECVRVGAFHAIKSHEANNGMCAVISRINSNQQGGFLAINFSPANCSIPQNTPTYLKPGVYPDLTVCDSPCGKNFTVGQDGRIAEAVVLTPKKALMFHTGIMS